MVNSAAILQAESGEALLVLSLDQTMQELGVEKITLYNWMLTERIKREGWVLHKIGKRHYFEFDPKEVARVKTLKKKKVGKGRSYFND